MKKYLAGLFTGVLVFTVAVSALAISGRMTIEVDPINVQVNGSTFQPTDVNGNAVPVFSYNGTTYAPLRALAEAYGLEVGYDKETNMATVAASSVASTSGSLADADEAAYQEFKGMWKLEESRPSEPREMFPDSMTYKFSCSSSISDDELATIKDNSIQYIERMMLEYAGDEKVIIAHFTNGSYTVPHSMRNQ